MMGRLAEHCAELGRAALGDVAVSIASAGLVGARDKAGVPGHMLGAGEAMEARMRGRDRFGLWEWFRC
jgi:hypothetical protein